jgi:hypothetical protein
MSKQGEELRFGNHGSMAINLVKCLFYDHEAKAGGGVVQLVMHVRGCDHDAAVEWLRDRGFLPNKLEQLIDCYSYEDETGGAILHQTVRFYPKQFRQRRPNPNRRTIGRPQDENRDDWIWDLKDSRLVLYRLPALIKGISDNKTVFVVEGEKDADRLHDLGMIATCNPMGEGKWRSDYTDMLKGADVVLIADNDDVGREHVACVAASLQGTARRVRHLDLPVSWPGCPAKGDISDWLDNGGGTVVLLNELVEALPDWQPKPGKAKVDSITDEPEWPVLDEDAYYGLVGDVVRTIDPHTEADPVAILVQLLAMFGNVIGHSPFYLVESDRHHANLYAVLVGVSSKGRKGTSAGRVRALVEPSDPTWLADRAVSGLSSGEGVIHAVRDPVIKWDAKNQCDETIDAGVKDKRLMVTEPEFAQALSNMQRSGNILSMVIRNGWDGQRLRTLTKSSPQKATGAHISIIAHVTETELRARLTGTEMANGFANRFLFLSVKRSKQLPFGGNLSESDVAKLGERVQEAVAFSQTVGRVNMTNEAARGWERVYPELSAERPGLLGAVTGRAEAQVLRIAMVYALLDRKDEIDVVHLRAALAVWDYCDQSAIRIFGDSLGNGDADEILFALRQNPEGMTRTAIQTLFNRNLSASRIDDALKLLFKFGLAAPTPSDSQDSGRGRRAEVWVARKAKGIA